MKLLFRIIFIFYIGIIAVVTNLYAVMITSTRLAYVDIEKVFESNDQISRAKDELEELILVKRKTIRDTEKAIASVRQKLKSNTGILKTEIPVISVEEISKSTANSVLQLPGIPQEYADSTSTAVVNDVVETPEVSVLPKTSALEEMEKSLAANEKLLRELMAESRKIIRDKEKELKTRIMAEVYEKIKEIALKEGYSVIFDKDAMYYSEDSVIDITQEIIRSLNE